MQMTIEPITRTITVAASQERAFEVFTAGFDTWWPRTHHTGGGELVAAVIEPRAGGRWWAKTSVGEEEWGRVLVWDPPHRIVLDWQLDADFTYDPEFHTDVEVRFVGDGPTRTRVEFEHRNLERYGDRAAELRGSMGSEGGWSGILSRYSDAAGS